MIQSVSPVLRVEELSVSYGGAGTHAVDGVSLSIAPGEVVALIGESGSGKSTLSKAVMGLLPATATISGRIALQGVDVTALPERDRARTRGRPAALVPQDPGTSLDPVLTIGKQLTEIFRLHRGKDRLSTVDLRDRAVELLEMVGIDRPGDRLRQYPHELSGGMKQRVLIAMAFGLRPDLIIADEPTSALDVTVQKQILEVFDRLAAESGVAALFVTHNLAVAADHASRALVMRSGKLLDGGPIEELLLGPTSHPYTRELIRAGFLGRVGVAPPPEPDPVAAPAIRVEGLTKRYPLAGRHNDDFAAVDGVSFTVPQASTFALVGESGSGKSTTAQLILGLTRPNSGHVHILGAETTHDRGRERRRVWCDIQLVYQNPQVALDPRFTVERIIEEPLRSFRTGNRAQRRERVRELLDRVGLSPALATRKPAELSGGQQQRVAIARALAPHSKIIILDEALSALDVLTQAKILDLLATLQAELSLTYLLISHDLNLVRSISQWVAVMRRGRIIEWGRTGDVFTQPQQEYTRDLLDSIPGDRFRALLRPSGEDPAPLTTRAPTATTSTGNERRQA